MTTRPNAALIMWPGVDDLVITPQVRAALAQVVTLVDDAPIDLMSTPLAELEAVEVLIGSWGCAPLDAASLLVGLFVAAILAVACGSCSYLPPATSRMAVTRSLPRMSFRT